MRYLIEVTEKIRVGTVKEVEELHQELKHDNSFFLKKFEYTHKEIKEKGEVVEEYELVKATKIFNEEKNPSYEVITDYTRERVNYDDMEAAQE